MNRLSVYLNTDKQAPRPRSTAAFSHSPLLKNIAPESLRFPEQGGVAVSIGNKHLSLLSDLTEIGQVLVISRNAHSILGEYRNFPAMITGENGQHCLSPDGSLEFDFSTWHDVLAIHDHRPQGHSYAVEICGPFKRSLHKVCLTPESRFRLFLEMVQEHHEPGIETTFPGSATKNKAAELHLPAHRRQSASNPSFLKETLPDLLQYLCQNRVAVEVRVENEGVSQSARFPIEEIKENDEWLYLSGGKTGWHLAVQAIESIHWTVAPTCSGSLWKIIAHDLGFKPIFELSGTCSLPERLGLSAALT